MIVRKNLGDFCGAMKYFFYYEYELPPGVGFSLFGGGHLLWLLGLAAAMGGCVWWFCRMGKPRRMQRIVSLIPLVLEAARLVYLALRGYLTVYELPLHLCGLAVFLCALDAFTRWDWLGQVLYGLCMPGAVLALLFCDWAMYPLASFVSINSFLSHGLLTLVPILGLVSGKIRPAPRKIWKPFAFLAVTVPLIYLFDWAFSANYFFLRVPAPGSPLEWMAGFLGNPGYLLGYFVLLVLAECALFLPWGLRHKQTEQVHETE